MNLTRCITLILKLRKSDKQILELCQSIQKISKIGFIKPDAEEVMPRRSHLGSLTCYVVSLNFH